MTEQCCPSFDAEGWQNRTHTWTRKRFIKDKVFCLMNMPVGFGHTMKRVMSRLEAAKAECPDWLCLSDHTSKWNMDVYVAVDREIPGAIAAELDGRFYSRVYEGPFSDTGKWCKDFEDQAHNENLSIEKQYLWYTTCPKCAKKYGKNPVVIFGKITE
ncbi:MAG TPA: hydrolase [Polyangiaceae bacterium]|nr:hydrolase [Polyangiaceae bacterium]